MTCEVKIPEESRGLFYMVWPIQQVKHTDDTEILDSRSTDPFQQIMKGTSKNLPHRSIDLVSPIYVRIYLSVDQKTRYGKSLKVRKLNLGSVILVFATRRAPN